MCLLSVLCNRSVSLQHIKSYGFDMDYTLAVYNVRSARAFPVVTSCPPVA